MRIQSRRAVWVVVLVAFARALALSAQPHLVTDLNQQRVPAFLPSQLSRGVEHGGALYFSGQDPQHGRELWRTDGTAEGTYVLVDLCPGRCDGGGQALGFFQGSLYFLGNDSEHGTEIWRTDGTVGGEELLADLCPGTCGTEPKRWVEWRGEIWFLIVASGSPVLWTSDGTGQNTRPVANLCDDLGLSCFDRDDRADLDGPDPSGQGLLLRIYSFDHPNGALFRTDGTAAGTLLLHRFADVFQIAVEPSGPLYFLDGLDLWTSDGTPSGTRFVRRFDDPEQGDVLSIKAVDGIFYAIFGNGDWLRLDGTAEGTIKLARLDFNIYSGPRVARIGGTVFAVTGSGVWRTGGTPETTVRFDGPLGNIESVIERPDRLFVMASDGTRFVWTVDGSGQARRIHLAGPPPPDGEIAGFREGILISRGFRELWRIDGAGARIERVHDFQPQNGGSGPIDQLAFRGRLLFLSLDGRSSKLFSSDGTAAGTAAISAEPHYNYNFSFDYRPDFYSLTRAGKRAFFRSGSILWTTDGSRAGTGPIYPSFAYPRLYLAAPIGSIRGRFLFGGNPLGTVRCDPGDTEPWVSDGTPGGTNRVLNLNPFFEPDNDPQCEIVKLSSSPGPGVSLGRVVLFAADDLLHGRELFSTDGTKAGTRRVADLNPNLQSNPYFHPESPELGPEQVGVGSDPSDLVRAGRTVFFVADDGRTGRELWATNGTHRGTRRVVDLVPGPAGSSPHDLVAVGDGIYFFASNPGGAAGEGLFKSDGTRAGTVRVSDLAGVSQARDLTVAADRLFFVAFRPESGTELWTSKGTVGTTREVADLRPGSRGSLPQLLSAVDDRVIFAADDGTSGLEPWTSDGTAEGTVRWGDIAAGRDASTPGPFSVVNDQILFGADDGEHGRELWAIPVADLPE